MPSNNQQVPLLRERGTPRQVSQGERAPLIAASGQHFSLKPLLYSAFDDPSLSLKLKTTRDEVICT